MTEVPLACLSTNADRFFTPKGAHCGRNTTNLQMPTTAYKANDSAKLVSSSTCSKSTIETLEKGVKYVQN